MCVTIVVFTECYYRSVVAVYNFFLEDPSYFSSGKWGYCLSVQMIGQRLCLFLIVNCFNENPYM